MQALICMQLDQRGLPCCKTGFGFEVVVILAVIMTRQAQLHGPAFSASSSHMWLLA